MTISPEHRAIIHLGLIPGVGNAVIRRLIDVFGSAEAALDSSDETLKGCLPGSIFDRVAKGRSDSSLIRKLNREIEFLESSGCWTVDPSDDRYPANLRSIFDPPPILFVKGTLTPEDELAVSIVGTRRATSYGKDVCAGLTREIVEAGFTVVSGLARGIDTVAHRSALDSGGRTVAVLGSGLARIYPRENVALVGEITSNGAVISEFAPSTPPKDLNFPRRNRIISGLSVATVVVEAGERSGALITADFALEQGREVLAVPGSIFSRVSKGTHQLIKEGAALIESVDDLLAALNIQREERRSEEPGESGAIVDLSENERKVLSLITTTPIHIDQITAASGLPPGEVAGALLMLELKDQVGQLPGKMFVKRGVRPI